MPLHPGLGVAIPVSSSESPGHADREGGRRFTLQAKGCAGVRENAECVAFCTRRNVLAHRGPGVPVHAFEVDDRPSAATLREVCSGRHSAMRFLFTKSWLSVRSDARRRKRAQGRLRTRTPGMSTPPRNGERGVEGAIQVSENSPLGITEKTIYLRTAFCRRRVRGMPGARLSPIRGKSGSPCVLIR